MEHVDRIPKLASEIMEELTSNYSVPQDKQMLLFTHIRLAQAFSKYEKRMQCVQARLQAISILVYSNAIQDNVNMLLYNGLIEELVDILEVKDAKLWVSSNTYTCQIYKGVKRSTKNKQNYILSEETAVCVRIGILIDDSFKQK